MILEVKHIHLTASLNTDELVDNSDCYTDIIVEMINGDKYVASAFTYTNIETLKNKHKKSGEYLNGKYLWAKGMFLIQNCTQDDVSEVVTYLINEGEFTTVFYKIST